MVREEGVASREVAEDEVVAVVVAAEALVVEVEEVLVEDEVAPAEDEEERAEEWEEELKWLSSPISMMCVVWCKVIDSKVSI